MPNAPTVESVIEAAREKWPEADCISLYPQHTMFLYVPPSWHELISHEELISYPPKIWVTKRWRWPFGFLFETTLAAIEAPTLSELLTKIKGA